MIQTLHSDYSLMRRTVGRKCRNDLCESNLDMKNKTLSVRSPLTLIFVPLNEMSIGLAEYHILTFYYLLSHHFEDPICIAQSVTSENIPSRRMLV